MNGLRILVCDDEPLAVVRLTTLLERIGQHAEVLQAGSGREAIDTTLAKRPDLLLVDIEMPGLDGFDVVEAIARTAEAPPLVAFVTAFRRFAPKAFDSGAIDFLCKPVRMARLEDTLQRARTAIEGREAKRRLDELTHMLGELRTNADTFRDAHVWVPRRGEVIRVDLDDLERVDAEGAYVRLNSPVGSLLHREPIGSLQERLDPNRFVRVHRSHLVRVDQIAVIRRTLHGASELVLRSGERVPIGRKYAKATRERVLAGTNAQAHDGGGSPLPPGVRADAAVARAPQRPLVTS